MSTPAQKPTIARKSFDSPDETRAISKGKVEVVNLGDITAMRATFEPGWRWSESVKPLAGTESCEVSHLVYVISGRMGLRMNDGTETEIGPGDVASIPPGHDAWIIGDEACVAVDFQGSRQRNRRSGSLKICQSAYSHFVRFPQAYCLA